MSPHNLKLIAAGLALLLLLWGASALLSRGSDSVRGSLELHAPAMADVDAITIVKSADTIALARQSAAPTAWTVNGHPAALASVTDLFQALRDTIPPELVAQDSSSFRRLQVDSAGGRWLRLRRSGKLQLELVVGGRGPDFESAYLRRPGDTRVYLWHGRLGALVDRTLDDWRDKRIATLAPDSVAALEVVRGKERYALTRAGRAWKMNGAAVDSGAVARYLGRLKTITAAGFATQNEIDSTRAARPGRRLTVRSARGGRGGRGGVLLSLAFDSTAGAFVVRHVAGAAGEGASVYRMNTWDVDGLTPASRSLLPTKK